MRMNWITCQLEISTMILKKRTTLLKARIFQKKDSSRITLTSTPCSRVLKFRSREKTTTAKPHLSSSLCWFTSLCTGRTSRLIQESCLNLWKTRAKSSTDSCRSWQSPPFLSSCWKDTSIDVTPKLWSKVPSMKLWTLEAPASSINKKWDSSNNLLRGPWLSSCRLWRQATLMSREEELKISWKPCMEVKRVSTILMIQEPKLLSLREPNMSCIRS